MYLFFDYICSMTRLEKCELLKDKGYTYDVETGKIYNRFNKEIIGKSIYGYSIINYKKKQSFGHHFAWYMTYNNVDFKQLDHINKNRSDNRICNLRIVTNQKNQFNTNAKGYYWNKECNKFHSRICINRKIISLGYFNTEQEANQAYLIAKEKYHTI